MNTPKTSTDTSTPALDDLHQQIEALQTDIKKLAATLSDNVTGGIGQAGRQISRAGRDAQATATDTVKEHPLTSVGIAAGLGFLLGTIARKV